MPLNVQQKRSKENPESPSINPQSYFFSFGMPEYDKYRMGCQASTQPMSRSCFVLEEMNVHVKKGGITEMITRKIYTHRLI